MEKRVGLGAVAGLRGLGGPCRSPLGRGALAVLAGLGLLASCSASDAIADGKASGGDDGDWLGGSDGGGFPGPGGGGIGVGGGGSSTGGAPNLPPEQELPLAFERPQAGSRFVFVANPDRDTVAVIDGTTLGITSVEVHDEPRHLSVRTGKDEAVVLNVGSADASVIRMTDQGARVSHLGVDRGANSISVAPDGRHAVVHYDQRRATRGAPAGSFQAVSVLTLDAEAGDRVTGMTVGFRPTDVFFSADGARAFLVTEGGVSILDFAAIERDGAGRAPPVPLGNVGVDQPRDVMVTSDGLRAIARQDGDPELRLVDLSTGDVTRLDLGPRILSYAETLVGGPVAASFGADAGDAAPPLVDGGVGVDSGAGPDVVDAGTPGPDAAPVGDGGGAGDGGVPVVGDGGGPVVADGGGTPVPDGGGPPVQIPPFQITDLDLSPDGTFALGVLRELGLVVKIPVPGGFADPSTIEVLPTGGVFVGSAEISSGGRVALLYTNADPSVEAVVILPLDGAAPRPVALEKGVLAVAIAPDEETAFIVHSRQPGDPAEPGLDLDAQIDRQEGYSLLRIDENFPTLAVTPVAPGPFALTPDGERLFVLFAGPGLAEVHSVDLVRSQAAVIPLGSRPLSVGAMPGSTSVFVGQDHPDGRLSFIDWQTGLVQTVTGFELNGRIRE